MSEEHPQSKTQNIYLISKSMEDLKERMKDNDQRLRDVEDISRDNKHNHSNTHEKLDNIMKLCEKTDSRIRLVEDTILEHKTKIKTIGAAAGVIGGGASLLIKFIFDSWNKGSH